MGEKPNHVFLGRTTSIIVAVNGKGPRDFPHGPFVPNSFDASARNAPHEQSNVSTTLGNIWVIHAFTPTRPCCGPWHCAKVKWRQHGKPLSRLFSINRSATLRLDSMCLDAILRKGLRREILQPRISCSRKSRSLSATSTCLSMSRARAHARYIEFQINKSEYQNW